MNPRDYKTVLVRCLISAGPFSGERVIRVPYLNGGEFVGTVPVGYCRLTRTEPLPLIGAWERGDPPVKGFVVALLIEEFESFVSAYMPDGSKIALKHQDVPYEVRRVEKVVARSKGKQKGGADEMA